MNFRRNFVVLLAFVCANAAAYAQRAAAMVPVVEVTSQEGRRSLLIGSLHVGIAGIAMPDTAHFLPAAKRLVIEHRSQKEPTKEAGEGALSGWAKQLTDGEIETLVSRAACGGIGRDEALKQLTFKSVQTANQTAYTVCGVRGRLFSRDDWMLASWLGLKRGLPDVLEDDEWVESLRLRISEEDRLAGLRWILARDPLSVLESVVDTLNRGDYDQLSRLVGESYGDPAAAARYLEIMVNERNRHWMAPLSRYLNEGEAVVVVGAMHLPGPGGLMALLRSRGFEVRERRVPAYGQPRTGHAS